MESLCQDFFHEPDHAYREPDYGYPKGSFWSLMTKANWLNDYSKLTPGERTKRIAKILAEGVLSLIREKNRNSREDDKKDVDKG